MKTATVQELREHFPRLCQWVNKGETVAITRWGRVVARLAPPIVEPSRTLQMPDWSAQRRKIFGPGKNRTPLSEEDSAFVMDRGDR